MLRRTVTLTAVAVPATVLLATGALAQGDPAAPTAAAHPPVHRVAVHDADGAAIGTVTFRQHGGKVRVTAALRGLEEGFHGFHVHDVGLCDPADPDGPFDGAGGHYVGDGEARHGDHAGDLPSLYVRADGRADLSVVTDAFTLDELLAGNGTAVMVHEDPDNFAHIPEDRYVAIETGKGGPDDQTLRTGDAGSRIACGELRTDPGVEHGAGLVTVPSEAPVAETVERITGDIEAAGLTLVAVVDHAAAAPGGDGELRPTTVIMVGDPVTGTALMQSAQTAGIDLPWKLLVWEDAEGRTHVTYNDPRYVAARHGITDQDAVLTAAAGVLHDLATGHAPQ